MLDWKVGQQVVCIHRIVMAPLDGMVVPMVGGIYTIRSFSESVMGEIGVRFEEIRNPKFDFGCVITEPSFSPSRFRPVKETSIECFRKLLAPQDRMERA